MLAIKYMTSTLLFLASAVAFVYPACDTDENCKKKEMCCYNPLVRLTTCAALDHFDMYGGADWRDLHDSSKMRCNIDRPHLQGKASDNDGVGVKDRHARRMYLDSLPIKRGLEFTSKGKIYRFSPE
ncbi:hypothetical protein B0H34DRAFT_195533 [Crassisporium funariophilum]|nr:hypothetical protein B0H34DRAFT_195533 [Crassisporium funariophilum]